jgi:hypothetical protein
LADCGALTTAREREEAGVATDEDLRLLGHLAVGELLT